MGDIAGARIVVPSLALQSVIVEMVEAGLRLEGYAISTKTTLAEPDQYGYRAVHLMLRRGGRFAEVQIRTIFQGTLGRGAAH